MLVDGKAYFAAFREAAINAERSILILGWDFDSRTDLVHGSVNDGFPVRVGELFDALIQRRRELRIHILSWDFVMLYAPDREMFPTFKLNWRHRHRLRFHLDDAHPVGASQHQKVVVIDDALAFVGGLDLAECRWDTPAHCARENQRCKHSGDAYPPYHDVQMMVDGEAAAALGELARERWRRATVHTSRFHRRIPRIERLDPWPTSVAPDLTDIEVGIARTEPGYKHSPMVQEVKQLYVDAIGAAHRCIYMENQYLTADVVREALEQSLRAPRGPEIVIVGRSRGGGWLERNTMGVLRARLLKRLRAVDHQRRLRVYYPDNAGLGEQCIDTHSKIMIVDDWLLRVGSANLNNRSMGLDTECDLAVEAADTRTRQAITRFRDRLLAEHLGVEPGVVTQTLQQKNGSLIATIEALGINERCLKPLDEEIDPEIDALIPDGAVIDPEHPITADQIVNRLLPAETHSSSGKRVAVVAGALLVIAALAGVWRWTPLGEWVSADALMRAAGIVRASPLAWLWVLGGFLAASLLAVPITAMILATVMVFGPILGFGYALLGSLAGAALTFGLGQLIGRRTVYRIAGERINQLIRHMREHGLMAVLAVRIFPVAPFTVVNLVAGAAHLRWRDFLLGTMLGMAPGILAVTLFSDRLVAAIRNPSPTTLAILAIAVAAIVAGALFIRRWLARHHAAPTNASL